MEEALYRKFTEQNDVANQTDDEETLAFQKFTEEVYRIEKGTNIIEILSTMISPDLEGNEALQLLRYQQSCTARGAGSGSGPATSTGASGPAYNGISCVLVNDMRLSQFSPSDRGRKWDGEICRNILS